MQLFRIKKPLVKLFSVILSELYRKIRLKRYFRSEEKVRRSNDISGFKIKKLITTKATA